MIIHSKHHDYHYQLFMQIELFKFNFCSFVWLVHRMPQCKSPWNAQHQRWNHKEAVNGVHGATKKSSFAWILLVFMFFSVRKFNTRTPKSEANEKKWWTRRLFGNNLKIYWQIPTNEKALLLVSNNGIIDNWVWFPLLYAPNVLYHP